MSNTVIRPKDRAEWLEYRKDGIGSSEVATILGLNPWETPYQLWRRKKGLDAPRDETFAMKAGHYLEDAVSQFWADESRMRQTMYIKQGQCNVFGGGQRKTKSMPLSIWTEQDIWDYIKERNLPISDIYNKGAKRTGCMFCGYGCQFKNDNRLQLVYDMYPKFYKMFMNYENNGVKYRDAMRKVLAVNGLYLPDEKPSDLLYF